MPGFFVGCRAYIATHFYKKNQDLGGLPPKPNGNKAGSKATPLFASPLGDELPPPNPLQKCLVFVSASSWAVSLVVGSAD